MTDQAAGITFLALAGVVVICAIHAHQAPYLDRKQAIGLACFALVLTYAGLFTIFGGNQ